MDLKGIPLSEVDPAIFDMPSCDCAGNWLACCGRDTEIGKKMQFTRDEFFKLQQQIEEENIFNQQIAYEQRFKEQEECDSVQRLEDLL